MDLVYPIITPIILLILIGVLCARYFGFTREMETGYIRFVMDVAIPFTLLRALSEVELVSFNTLFLMLSYYIPVYSFFAIGLYVGLKAFKRDQAGAVVTAIGFCFSNTVLIGLPIILSIYGDAGGMIFFTIISMHGATLFIIITLCLEMVKSSDAQTNQGEDVSISRSGGVAKRVVTSLAKTTLLYGIFGGLTLNILDISLPAIITNMSLYLQDGMVGLSLIALGMSLTRYNLAGRLFQNIVMIFFKMMLLPLFVFILSYYVFDIPLLWVKVATLLASMPVGVTIAIYSERYDAGRKFASTAVFLSNIVAIFSVTGWIIFLESLPIP